MSGWEHEKSEAISIAGEGWTERVFDVSSVVGHTLTPGEYDQGEPGRFNASHAEKQLIAYFIKKHVFLPGECEPSSKLNGTLHYLFESQPPVALTKATILVNRAPCDDCRAFIWRVKSVLKIDFEVIFC